MAARIGTALIATLLAAFVVVTGAGVTEAYGTADRAADHAGGACTSDSGVTVVVDARALGGGTSVRCVENARGMTGLEALEAAGHEATGTRRYGAAFVCRIDGRPGPDKELSIPGNDGYRESCANTPPTAAMWAYYSGRDGDWTYNRTGASTRTVEPGGYEGWVFTAGAPEGSNEPEVEPAAAPAATPRSPRTAEPSQTAEPSESSGPSEPRDASASQDESGSVTPWVATAVVLGLGALATGAELRRRRSRRGGP